MSYGVKMNDSIALFAAIVCCLIVLPTPTQSDWVAFCGDEEIAHTGMSDEGAIVEALVACEPPLKVSLEIDAGSVDELSEAIKEAAGYSTTRTSATGGLRLKYACSHSKITCLVADRDGARSEGPVYYFDISMNDMDSLISAVNLDDVAPRTAGMRSDLSPLAEALVNGVELLGTLTDVADMFGPRMGTARTASVRPTASARPTARTAPASGGVARG